jgi:hypothetical protein
MAKKKCSDCGAPLEGFLYNTLGKVFGIKPSESNPEVCNKCEDDTKEPVNKKKEQTEKQKIVEETPTEETEHKVEPKSAQQLLESIK